MSRSNVDVFMRAEAILGEGPYWDAASERLLWVDILGRRVHVAAAGGARSIDLPDYVSAAVATGTETTLLVSLGTGAALLDTATGQAVEVARTGADPRTVRVNDAKLDAAGRLWLGTTSLDDAPGRGALYRIEPDGELERVLDGLSVSNGPAWSLDGEVMYHVDSPTKEIRRFDVAPETGQLGAGRRFVDTSSWPGLPDGMTVDVNGNLWVAFWDGSAIRCFSKDDGELLDVVEVPVRRPTSCVFGGPRLATLLVTSARVGQSPAELAEQPLAGSVLALDVGVCGPRAARADFDC